MRPLLAYDCGTPAPSLESGAPGLLVQELNVAGTVAAVADRVLGSLSVGRSTAENMVRRCRRLLEWLAGFDGSTWERRWIASGADRAPRTWVSAGFPGLSSRQQAETKAASFNLIQARVLRPSYGWLLDCGSVVGGLRRFLEINDPGRFAELQELPAWRSAEPRNQFDAERCLARVSIRTGKTLDQLRGEELLHYADVVRTSGRLRREHLAWELMIALGHFAGESTTLRAAWSAKGNTRQHTVATLVDRYGIPASGVRDLLVDYLGELRAGLDYSSLEGLAYRLVRLFWWEILQVNPAQTDLRLSVGTATQWRERLAVTTDGHTRRETHSILFAVRGLYRDLAEWAYDDPARWAIWAAPCPVLRSESRGAAKNKRRRQATTQARTRALTPLLPALVTAGIERRDWGRALLAAASHTADSAPFSVAGVRLVRCAALSQDRVRTRCQIWARVVDADPATRPVPRERGGLVNVTRIEDDGFWAWAIAETLRLTGVRIEELLELTQLSLRQYIAPTTNAVVPLLHIVPSKTDTERLIPMSPELVTVLLEVQRRGKGGGDHVPLSVRYDPHEKTHGEPLPHLFARRLGTRHEVISPSRARVLLNSTAVWADLRDGPDSVAFTPHDFRRLFATELVGSGLPMHIVAELLGHSALDTTRGYTAVFPDHVLAAHQAFIERRRTLRPDADMRPATSDEWHDFEQHFLLRKVALGDCHRPYGTPCVHEHACTRCRFLRVDPAQLGRIEDMTANAETRLVEARDKVWLGEVAALEENLTHLRRRRAEAQARADDPLEAPTPAEELRSEVS